MVFAHAISIVLSWCTIPKPLFETVTEITLRAYRIRHRTWVTETLRVDCSDHEQVDCIRPQSSHSIESCLNMVGHRLPAIAHRLAENGTEMDLKTSHKTISKWSWVSVTKVNGWKLNTHIQNIWSARPSNETFEWIHFIQPQSRAYLTECHAQQNETQSRRCDSP